MPRVGDVNLTPIEYADSIRKQVEKIAPSRLFTYRYIWQKDDSSSLSVTVLSGPMTDHERFRENLQKDEHVVSATAEYLSEIDCNYLLIVEGVVANKKEKEKKE